MNKNKNSKSKKDNESTVGAISNTQSKIVWKSHGEFFNAVRKASLTNKIDPRLVIKGNQ